MVEHLFWEQGVAGSSPVIPTKILRRKGTITMLKIKDDVDLRDLGKINFFHTEKQTWWALGTKRIIIDNKTRYVSINAPANEVYDKLYELIMTGYVEVVEQPRQVHRDRMTELERIIFKHIEYLDEKGMLDDYEVWSDGHTIG